MTRQAAIAVAQRYFDEGVFFEDLARRVAVPSTSQEPEHADALKSYLDDEMRVSLAALGYDCEIFENPTGAGPIMIARRIEDTAFPTVLTYGHGDTVRGQNERWRDGIEPWRLVAEGERWYGRGTADNKGQHSINIGALASKPVMEGKAVLFKKFAYIDCFDIELDQNDPEKLAELVCALEPTFGANNLEDIKAPHCYTVCLLYTSDAADE